MLFVGFGFICVGYLFFVGVGVDEGWDCVYFDWYLGDLISVVD